MPPAGPWSPSLRWISSVRLLGLEVMGFNKYLGSISMTEAQGRQAKHAGFQIPNLLRASYCLNPQLL